MPGPITYPWMEWLKSHIGEVEKTGSPTTDFDNRVFAHTNFGSLKGIMQPGCAATACAALEETGFKSPHSAAAQAFIHYGDACDLKSGCVVVFQWMDGDHHISFCDHILDDKYVACLGGNQGHELKMSVYERKYIIATRWPSEALKEQK